MTISQLPRSVYNGGDVPNQGTAVDIEYPDGNMLWDDSTTILWDDLTVIEWSHSIATSPDVGFSFSSPRIVYAGEAE